MRVRTVKQLNVLVNGIKAEQFAVGEVHEVSAGVGAFMIAAGWVRQELRCGPRRRTSFSAGRSAEERRVRAERRVMRPEG